MTHQRKQDSPFIPEKHKAKPSYFHITVFNLPLVPLLFIFVIINIVLWVLTKW